MLQLPRISASIRVTATIVLMASTTIAADPTINTSLIYDGAAFADLAGGLRRGNTYLGALRLQFAFQSRGLTVYTEGLSIHGGQPSELAGDAQGVSNIAATSRTRIEEAWLQ